MASVGTARASTSMLRTVWDVAGGVAGCRYCRIQTSRASLHTSSQVTARALTADRIDREGDPFDFDNLKKFDYDDIPWTAHQKLDDDRDRIRLMRLIAFQMPEIAKANTPLPALLPRKKVPLQIRTQIVLGAEGHPSMRKAVLTARVSNITSSTRLTTSGALRKFKLLAGPRYDPASDTIKISCDSFPTVAMNTKWASDALDRLLAAAEDTADPMTDIVLRYPHAEMRKIKKGKYRATLADFPKRWLEGISK